ncbi:response regulator [Methylobacterium sp. J-059]|uniref:hybrid sensor histidine kinase/response regulator n=1 Tax=Methylobacterium sp. J-059 TaxID=2836643 RepID=UPI001FBBEE18|nr:response regulator [Methylobacterium sp. J-059]MCJ2038190.1 response regulator [Methylobacterium sp. J-059]
MTDIRQLLLAAFEVEHREHIDAIRAALGADGTGRAPDWNDIFRRAHSLKGASRAVDLPPVEAVAHRLESLFEKVSAGAALDREARNATHLALDRIEAYVAGMKADPDVAMPADAIAALDRCLAGARAPDATTPSPAEIEPPVEAEPPVSARPPAEPKSAAPSSPAAPPSGVEPPAEAGPAFLRVPADAVEALTRASHELASTLGVGSAISDGLARLARLSEDLRRQAEASFARGAVSNLARLLRQEAGRDAGSDRDEAVGLAVEAVRTEMRGVEASLAGLAREAADLSRRQVAAAGAVEGAAARVGLQAERLALVPAETVFGSFPRSLRETAREQGREIDLAVRGLDLPVDRAMLQALKDPVLHALRNALSHGAEPLDIRRAAGKPDAAAILFEVAIRGGRLVVSVADDGPGPDLAAIEATALRRLLLRPGDPTDPQALLALVFEPGFSTAAAVDALSGRGFGLSVVADAARALQGSARLEPREPWGSILTISAPLSAARRAMLLVEAGGATYALPGAAVERLLRLDRAGLPQAMGRPVLRVPGAGGAEETFPIVALAEILGGPASASPHLTAILVRAGGRRFALAVDALHDVRTLLVLPAPPVGAESGLVAGTVILPGDVPALVLDPDGLAARAGAAGAAARPGDGVADAGGTLAEAPRSKHRATILVVDDSITTRTLEKGILEAAGYRVVVCVDGQDALDRLHADIEVFDLVLADVEMPRLDGFGLLAAIRAETRFARLPVVLMTSRGDAADVARGLDLGADAYLTKQKFDQRQLLDTIGQLL